MILPSNRTEHLTVHISTCTCDCMLSCVPWREKGISPHPGCQWEVELSKKRFAKGVCSFRMKGFRMLQISESGLHSLTRDVMIVIVERSLLVNDEGISPKFIQILHTIIPMLVIRCFVINIDNLSCFIFAIVLRAFRGSSFEAVAFAPLGQGPPRCCGVLVYCYTYIYIHILWESLGFTDCVYVAMLHYINLYQYLWLSMSKIVRVCVCVCLCGSFFNQSYWSLQ